MRLATLSWREGGTWWGSLDLKSFNNHTNWLKNLQPNLILPLQPRKTDKSCIAWRQLGQEASGEKGFEILLSLCKPPKTQWVSLFASADFEIKGDGGTATGGDKIWHGPLQQSLHLIISPFHPVSLPPKLLPLLPPPPPPSSYPLQEVDNACFPIVKMVHAFLGSMLTLGLPKSLLQLIYGSQQYHGSTGSTGQWGEYWALILSYYK